MAEALPPVYIHRIASIHETLQNTPPVLGNIDLNRSIPEGAPIDSQELRHAQLVAKGLRVWKDMELPVEGIEVTTDLVEHAELRATAIESAHSSAIYAPTNIANALAALAAQMTQMGARFDQRFDQIDARLDQIDARLDQIEVRLTTVESQVAIVSATTRNNRILICNNQQGKNLNNYDPLQKTVAGHGVQLATAIYGNIQNLRLHLAPPPQPAAIGTTPPNFNPSLSTYKQVDLLKLIIFYNENFGIGPGDTLAISIGKFNQWLVTY